MCGKPCAGRLDDAVENNLKSKAFRDAVVEILKKKLTREPGKQLEVVENPQMLQQRGAVALRTIYTWEK
jgi:hypothetical protein